MKERERLKGIWALATPLPLLVIVTILSFILVVATETYLLNAPFLALVLLGWIVTMTFRVRFGRWPNKHEMWRRRSDGWSHHNRWPKGHPYHRPGRDD